LMAALFSFLMPLWSWGPAGTSHSLAGLLAFLSLCPFAFKLGKLENIFNRPVKTKIMVPVLLACACGMAGVQVLRGALVDVSNPPSQTERGRMSLIARFVMLERMGRLPDDVGYESEDQPLAAMTSWWGRPLDPEKFWEGRVVWLDDGAQRGANLRGRAYPPIPVGAAPLTGGWEFKLRWDASSPYYKWTQREADFWKKFHPAHPVPPKEIKKMHEEEATSWMHSKDWYERENHSAENISQRWESSTYWLRRESKCPPESISPEAFHWEYVMRKRAEYEKLVASGKSEDPHERRWFFDVGYYRVRGVDRALITEPLTQAQLDAANAWKVAYLNRLRAENWDESYIRAYLQAWNLAEEYVFGKGGADPGGGRGGGEVEKSF